jgi:RNA recognition motif-containing protein
MDRAVGLSRGFAYVEFETSEEAENARASMDGGQLDGNVIT